MQVGDEATSPVIERDLMPNRFSNIEMAPTQWNKPIKAESPTRLSTIKRKKKKKVRSPFLGVEGSKKWVG